MITATTSRSELEHLAAERKLTVYLAGAIDKVPPEFALEWRRQATEALQNKYNILDPTANKDLFQPDVNVSVYTPAQIVEHDLEMIRTADIILAEISRKDLPYHGTSMELSYAYNWQKVIYVWGGCRSYWVRYHATKIFDGLPEAIEHLLYL